MRGHVCKMSQDSGIHPWVFSEDPARPVPGTPGIATNARASLPLQPASSPPVRDTKVEVTRLAKDLLQQLRKGVRQGKFE